MSITITNGTGNIKIDYGTGRVETCQKGSFRTVIKGDYVYLVFNNVDNIFPKYEWGDNHSLMRDKIELLYTDVTTPSEASATDLRDTILGWNGVAILPTGAATSAKQLPNDHDVTVSNMIPAVETGLATSAKQLADDHNVTVSNMISDVETGLAKDTTLTDGTQKSQIVDDSGNAIDSHLSTDGGYHLGTSITQSVYADPNNTSAVNLASGATFEGTGTTTLGIVGLQWSLKTSENCTVYIEESDDNSDWDISYSFDYIASKGGRGETVQATKAYWRIRVTNEGLSTTSYFRLSGVLCPIAVPLPSGLSPDGRLKSQSTLAGRENTDRHVWVNPTNELAISPVYRLVGTTFIGAVLDPNFWSDDDCDNDGTVTQGGGLVELSTSASLNGIAILESVRKGRFVAGSALYLSGAANWVTAGTASNVRRVGCFTDTDGYFFQLNGTTFSVGTRIGSADTLVNSGSFNGNLGSIFTPVADTYYKITIEWTPLGVLFYIGSTLLHKINGAGLSGTITLPIKVENDNGAITTDISFKSLGLYIARQGELVTNPTLKAVSGTSTTICKYGAGILKGAIFGNVTANSVITIYDNTAASGTVIFASGSMEKKVNPFHVDFFELPFSIGLTLLIATQDSNVTLVYE